jgi:hypothetical protein
MSPLPLWMVEYSSFQEEDGHFPERMLWPTEAHQNRPPEVSSEILSVCGVTWLCWPKSLVITIRDGSQSANTSKVRKGPCSRLVGDVAGRQPRVRIYVGVWIQCKCGPIWTYWNGSPFISALSSWIILGYEGNSWGGDLPLQQLAAVTWPFLRTFHSFTADFPSL